MLFDLDIHYGLLNSVFHGYFVSYLFSYFQAGDEGPLCLHDTAKFLFIFLIHVLFQFTKKKCLKMIFLELRNATFCNDTFRFSLIIIDRCRKVSGVRKSISLKQ